MEITDLLQEADRLHGQGALAEAAGRYRLVLESDPEHPQALYRLAVIACQQGRLEEGIVLVRHSLAREPRQPRALNLLGMALSRLGQDEAALASYDRALALQPDLADVHGNRAGLLLDRGRAEEAVAGFECAVALDPAAAGDWLNLATAHHRLGRNEEALASCDRALALDAGFSPAHCNRANVLASLGRCEEALASYDRALSGSRRYADALAGRAQVLLRLDRVGDAIASLEELLAVAPQREDALTRLVETLIACGDHARALRVVVRALEAKASDTAKSLFVQCVVNRRFRADPGGVQGIMVRALVEPWERPADLAVPATSLVKLNPAVAAMCARAVKAWPRRLTVDDLAGRLTAMADDALLRAVLETVPVCDAELERALTGLRAIFLAAAADGPVTPTEDGLLRFFCALARQCFINEYVFAVDADERANVERLRERLVRSIAAGGPVPVLWLIATAMFLPLGSLSGAERLVAMSWSPSLGTLIQQQVREPLQEGELQASIAELTPVVDGVSLKVKQQYEENPYPRWVKAAPVPEPRSLAEYFGAWIPALRGAGDDGLDMLVAGCGSGQSLVETARQLEGARVLAIDLSRASLGFAKRQALTLGLSNITFAVADILRLADLGRTFDVVEACGVLHHMADPWSGWRTLIGLLRPGGFMRVALYSRLGRADVNAARAFAAERKYRSTPDDIRRCRQELLALPADAAARRICRQPEFFTASECRDLLMHVEEHQMTLPEIAGFIGDAGVDFMGFLLDPGMLARFQARFPEKSAATDLARWHQFELEHPETFAGMYQFWLRKSSS
jgi:tetratricopeptide (TPR) repeat protein/2-polyprenyl-3-methyl-5-hydroxy-6-metoxy-1,4-benzoquinol methylase